MEKHAKTVMVGRTLMKQALPVTFRVRVAHWAVGLEQAAVLLEGQEVYPDAMQRNLAATGDGIMAEPVAKLLAPVLGADAAKGVSAEAAETARLQGTTPSACTPRSRGGWRPIRWHAQRILSCTLVAVRARYDVKRAGFIVANALKAVKIECPIRALGEAFLVGSEN